MKRALLVGTPTAVSENESGASLRLKFCEDLLSRMNFVTKVVASNQSSFSISEESWDLIVFVSFSSIRDIRLARKNSSFLWLDATDSFLINRFSLFANGDIKQLFIFFKDLFFMFTCPKLDVITYITNRDKNADRFWWRFRSVPIVVPITNLIRNVSKNAAKRFVFIGDGDYFPNKKAINFLQNVLKIIDTSIDIHVFGKGYLNKHENFIFHGYQKSDSLYFENDIHLAPIFSGSGMKIKVAIPLWNSINVISTELGATGFKKNGRLKIARDVAHFANLMTNEFYSESNFDSFKISGDEIYEVNEENTLVNVISNFFYL